MPDLPPRKNTSKETSTKYDKKAAPTPSEHDPTPKQTGQMKIQREMRHQETQNQALAAPKSLVSTSKLRWAHCRLCSPAKILDLVFQETHLHALQQPKIPESVNKTPQRQIDVRNKGPKKIAMSDTCDEVMVYLICSR